MAIHKMAVVSEGAQVDSTAEIGPFALIGPNVTIGPGTVVGAQAVIDGHTRIGANCKIYAGAAIGLDPQDLKYSGEPTGVVIGDRTVVREYVTIHRATGDRTTMVGSDCFLMAYCHIAHDCRIGNGVIMANNATLAGHTFIGDNVVMSGFCIMHQFSRIGRMVMVGGMTGSRVDLPPFTICDGRPAGVRGINVIGLRRNKVNADTRAAIKQTYKLIYRAGLNVSQAIARIEEEVQPHPEVKEIVEFFQTSKRGVAGLFDEKEEQGVMDEVPLDPV